VGRLILVRDPLGREVQYRYDALGNRLAVVNAENIATQYVYDELNRLVTVIENFNDGIYNPAITDEDVITEYDYDGVGNLIAILNPRGFVTIYQYDGLNRAIAVTDPLSHTTQYGYDAIGNRTVITDANQVTTYYEYDNANRLVRIDYPAPEADVTLSYDQIGNLITMTDGTGETVYTYDDLSRVQTIRDGFGQVITYTYDAIGNVVSMVYPDGKVVSYTYDAGNRLQTVTDWTNGTFGYYYDDANRLVELTRPNVVTTTYGYDPAGGLVHLAHVSAEGLLANYQYALNDLGYRQAVTETLLTAGIPVTTAMIAETNGLLAIEAEDGQIMSHEVSHSWLTKTVQVGYAGNAYVQAMPDTGTLYETVAISESAGLVYPIYVSTPATYTVWVRGMALNAAADSIHIGLNNQAQEETARLTGFVPGQWQWSRLTMSNTQATVVLDEPGSYLLNLWMREDGVRVDRLLLVTDINYIPTGLGPVASPWQVITITAPAQVITQVITYSYDNLSRLTAADYNQGTYFHYTYDAFGNRLTQTTNTGTHEYVYDNANRLSGMDGVSYVWDANGNLLFDGQATYTYNSANQLTSLVQGADSYSFLYNGQGDRVQQTVNGVPTTYLLDPKYGVTQVLADPSVSK